MLLLFITTGFYFMLFSNKNIKDLCDMFELNHHIENPKGSRAHTPHVLLNSILTKVQRFLSQD